MDEKITRHAGVRMRQRGIRNGDLWSFLEIADITVPVGRGLHAMRASSECLAEAAGLGMPRDQIGRLQTLSVIQASDGTLVTCAHLFGRKSKAYLRRDRPKFWRN